MHQGTKTIDAKGAPVVVNKDTLFQFYAPQGLFDTKERAEIVSKRLEGLINRMDFSIDSLSLKNDTVVSAIYYKSQLLLALLIKTPPTLN